MKRYFFFVIFQVFVIKALATGFPIHAAFKITDIRLQSISGIINVNGQFWAVPNSGFAKVYRLNVKWEPHQPFNELYQFNRTSVAGLMDIEISDSTGFSNASNINWSDMAYDSTFIYIGDFGNKHGTRKDLRIYRFPISELGKQNVKIDTISFSYIEQQDFSSRAIHDFDSEALMATDSSLVLYTKGQGGKLYKYELNKVRKSQTLIRKEIINRKGTFLLTGIQSNNYGPSWNFMSCVVDTSAGKNYGYFSEMRYLLNHGFGSSMRLPLSFTALDEIPYQSFIMEDTTRKIGGQFMHVSVAKASDSLPAILILYGHASNRSELDRRNFFKIYPNPVGIGMGVHFETLKGYGIIEILNSKGQVVYQEKSYSNNEPITLKGVNPGIYIVSFRVNGEKTIYRKLIVE